MRPIHNLCTEGASEAIATLLELQADPNGGRGGGASFPPLGMLAFASAAGNNVLGTAQLLLDYKADVNQRCQPEDMYRFMELISRAYGQCSREPPLLVRLLKDVSTTALGICSIFDSKELATFLLHARADPEIRNNRGLRPVDLAVSEQMRRLLQPQALPACSYVPSQLVAENV